MSFAARYKSAILWIEAHCGGPDKFAHTHVGLAIWLAAALLCRRPLGSWTPLLILAALELANEVADRLGIGAWRWPDTIGDVAATLLWPVLLTLVLRRRRR